MVLKTMMQGVVNQISGRNLLLRLVGRDHDRTANFCLKDTQYFQDLIQGPKLIAWRDLREFFANLCDNGKMGRQITLSGSTIPQNFKEQSGN